MESIFFCSLQIDPVYYCLTYIFGMEINLNSSVYTDTHAYNQHTGSFSHSRRLFHSICSVAFAGLTFPNRPLYCSSFLYLLSNGGHCAHSNFDCYSRLIYIYLLISQYTMHMLTTLCVIFCVSSRDRESVYSIPYEVTDQCGGQHGTVCFAVVRKRERDADRNRQMKQKNGNRFEFQWTVKMVGPITLGSTEFKQC